MIFDATKVKQYDSIRGVDMITYPVGGADSKALAFLKVISKDALEYEYKMAFYMAVIYVGILENPIGARMSDGVEELFFNSLPFEDLENATSAQKRGLEPIAENIFSSEDPVGAYNRFQDLIFEYEQKKKEEEKEDAVALVAKKSETFQNIYLYSTKNGIGQLFDEMDDFSLKQMSPKTYFFAGSTMKIFAKPDQVQGLFVMTDEDDDIFYFIPINKSKGEDQNGDSGQGDPDGDEPGSGDPGSGDPGKGDPGKGDPRKGDPGKGDPGKGDPGKGDPGKGDPGKGDPGKGEPGDPGKGDPGDPGKGDPRDPGNGKPDDDGTCRPGENDPKDGDPKMCGPGGQPNPDDDDFDQEILRISRAIGVRPAQVAASFTSETRARSLLSGGNFEKLNESRTMSDYIGYVRSIM